MNNTKRRNILIVVGTLSSIAGIWLTISGMQDVIEIGRRNAVTVNEIVEDLQAELSIREETDKIILTQTGLEVRDDTVVFTCTMEPHAPYKESILAKRHELKELTQTGIINSIVKGYENNLLTHTACKEGMVFLYEYFLPDGETYMKIRITPEAYQEKLR